MEIWCHKRIPVEGNFGQTYDSVNQSIHGLSGEFSANIDIKVGGQGVEEGEVQTGNRGVGEEGIPARIKAGRRTREREEVSEWWNRPACGTYLSGLGMNGQCHEMVSIDVGAGKQDCHRN